MLELADPVNRENLSEGGYGPPMANKLPLRVKIQRQSKHSLLKSKTRRLQVV